jgi:hypothetical protein
LLLLTAIGLAGSLAACDDSSKSSNSGSSSGSSAGSSSTTTTSGGTQDQATPPAQAAAQATVPGAEISLARNIYVVFDGSGSMWNCPPDRDYDGKCTRKIIGAKWAIKEMIKKLPDDVNLGLYVFDEYGNSERVPLGPNNRAQFLAAVDHIRANNGTPLGGAVASGVQALDNQFGKQLGYGEYRLVVVTDGLPDSMADLQDALNFMQSPKSAAPVALYTIGFGISDPNHPLRKYSVIYTAADTETQVKDALTKATSELDSFDSTDFKK